MLQRASLVETKEEEKVRSGISGLSGFMLASLPVLDRAGRPGERRKGQGAGHDGTKMSIFQ